MRFSTTWLFNSDSIDTASAITLTYVVIYTTSKLPNNIITILTNCPIAASIATNLLSTVLIAYKLWLDDISSDVDD